MLAQSRPFVQALTRTPPLTARNTYIVTDIRWEHQ